MRDLNDAKCTKRSVDSDCIGCIAEMIITDLKLNKVNTQQMQYKFDKAYQSTQHYEPHPKQASTFICLLVTTK